MRFFTPFLLGLVASLPFIFALPNTKHRNTLSAAERVDPLLLQRFKLISQYAAAAYCFGNNDSTGTPVVCPEDNCPLVETANATSVYEFQNSGLTDTTGFIAVDDTNHLIVLSFRGSAEWKNWMANFQTVQIPFVFGVNFAEVHLGMLEAWKETEDGIVDNLMKAVKEHEDYQVVITGHSLGGGIATLAAVKLREKVPAELYTFGAPKTGNQFFADLVQASSDQNYRITNYGDPVIRLPLREYDHFEPEYHVFGGPEEEIGLDVGPDDIKIINGSFFGSSDLVFWFTEPIKFKQHTKYFGKITACSSDADEVAKQAEEMVSKEDGEKTEGDKDKIRRAELIWELQTLEEALQDPVISVDGR